jgi:hypothetical protein
MLNRYEEAIRRMVEELWKPREVALDMGIPIATLQNLQSMAQTRNHQPREVAPELPAWLQAHAGGDHLDRRAA